MALKDYPEYVLKHKAKGREIRFLNGKYYLYQVHSVRIDGKPKKFTDKYLGRITEEGLIPPVTKVIKYKVLECSTYVLAFHSCKTIIDSITKRYKSKYTLFLSNAFFITLFNSDINKWNKSYFSVIYKDFKLSKHTTSINDEINRIVSMINHSINKFLNGNTICNFLESINDLFMVGVKDSYTLALYSDYTAQILENYKIDLGEILCQK